ncbi:cache domain-containing protein [Endothiovibrio diazotrophicus]
MELADTPDAGHQALPGDATGGADDHEESRRLLAHMPDVVSCRQTLTALGKWWQKVTLIGKINSLDIAPTLIGDMELTKRRFEELQVKLIDNLVYENLRKLEQEAGARAQVTIDILIRNLFERTADVGFLATDDDLRAFLADRGDEPGARQAVVERLREYTLKYSVYDEILVLDTEGRVRAHLDADNPVAQSRDPLIAETLKSGAEYVETYRWSDLRPDHPRSLIYSCPIRADNRAGSPALGVLCLCFRLADEMVGVFANLARAGELIAILDREGRVMAASDQAVLPVESRVTLSHEGVRLVRHDGREYLACTRATHGYQGYFGGGWLGHVMVPVAEAFAAGGEEEGAATKLAEDSQLFSRDLRSISHNASMVTDDLILVVLNGQIISAKRDAAEFMPVLDEIRNIGNATQAVFDSSIANLRETVITSLLNEVRFQSFLAVDIMDRNLYERANDVRWWALTSRFRELLAGGVDDGARQTIGEILAYINNLYTVYTNLLVYDAHGAVVAVSNPEEAHWVGQSIGDHPGVQAALGLRESQHYRVSPFAATPLYGDRPTYVYHTSIRAPGPAARVVGGIGIVFDGEPQFRAMLDDALPRDPRGMPLAGAFALFADRDGRVIAATEAGPAVGSTLDLDERFLALGNGERLSDLITFAGRSYAVGAAMSQGYREYKTSGDYDNDVAGLVFVPI